MSHETEYVIATMYMCIYSIVCMLDITTKLHVIIQGSDHVLSRVKGPPQLPPASGQGVGDVEREAAQGHNDTESEGTTHVQMQLQNSTDEDLAPQRRVGPEYVVGVRGAIGVEEAGGEQTTAAEGQATGYTKEVTGAATECEHCERITFYVCLQQEQYLWD